MLQHITKIALAGLLLAHVPAQSFEFSEWKDYSYEKALRYRNSAAILAGGFAFIYFVHEYNERQLKRDIQEFIDQDCSKKVIYYQDNIITLTKTASDKVTLEIIQEVKEEDEENNLESEPYYTKPEIAENVELDAGIIKAFITDLTTVLGYNQD